ncbi:MAG: hypothetical protein J2P49_06585 [Methylocapsa sp.]|nr:hypothetical protein [Methylocapsa sp.]
MINHEIVTTYTPPTLRTRFRSFVLKDWPYMLMLGLALAGVARTSVDPTAMSSYWMTLAPVFGIICVAVQWRSRSRREARWHLIRTQVLHWAAAMLAMYVVFTTSVNRIMNADADALTVLAILALATFTAGIHADAWRICVVGLVMGLAIPAIAWLETSTVLILLILAVLIVVAVFVFLNVPPGFARRARPSPP